MKNPFKSRGRAGAAVKQTATQAARQTAKTAASKTAAAKGAAQKVKVSAGAARAAQSAKTAGPDQRAGAGADNIAALVYNRLRGWLAVRGLRYSVGLNLLLAGAVLVLTVALAHVANRPPPKPVYFATNPDGTITKLIPLDHPNGTKAALLNWIGRVGTDCFTFSFGNIERKVSECERKYFTTKGAGQYRGALVDAHIIQDTEDQELFQETSLNGAPVIVQSGHLGKRLAYKIKVPVNIRVFGPKVKDNTQKHNLYFLVVRAPTVAMPSGYAVSRFREDQG